MQANINIHTLKVMVYFPNVSYLKLQQANVIPTNTHTHTINNTEHACISACAKQTGGPGKGGTSPFSLPHTFQDRGSLYCYRLYQLKNEVCA